MLSTREKASWLLFKLYRMRNVDFFVKTVDDILEAATEEEIAFYFHWICEVKG